MAHNIRIETLKKNKLYIFAFLIIAVVVFMGQKALNEEGTTETTKQSSLTTVEKGNIASSVSASGTVESANFLSITTGVNGIVKQVFVKEGDTVVKGQKVMEVTLSSDGEESLAQAWSSYLSAKNSVEKAKTEVLSKETALINAQEAFDNEKEQNSYQSHDERISYTLAENAYNVAKQGYEQQQETIKQNEAALTKAWLAYQAQSPIIVAPDSGIVANILVVEGMDITNSLSERTSSSVASIKKEGNPIIALDISELDINSVKVGQKVNINLASIENKTFTGAVVGIDKLGSVTGGVTTYTVIVRFDESSDLVLPNMGADGEIIIEEKQSVLLVPASAITSEKQKTYVTVIKNGAETKTEIKIGITNGQNTQVISGLNEGDKVSVSALPTTGFTDAQNNDSFRGPGVFMR